MHAGARVSGLIGAALLAACSRGPEAPAVPAGGEHVACALGQGSDFTPECSVERSEGENEQVLILRHPDGGFRRVSVRRDGTGLAATDGADNARVAVSGNLLEVAIKDDRYRIPFVVNAHAASRTAR